MNIKYFSLSVLLIFTFSLVSSLPNEGDLSIDFTYEPDYVIEGANYSINVNNTEHLEGRNTATLWTYFTGLGNALWCQLTGCTMQGDIDMNGNDILNAENITANYFVGNGSLLTGIQGDNSSWNESYADSKYVPYTGATSQVDLGSNNLTTTGNITGNLFTINSLKSPTATLRNGALISLGNLAFTNGSEGINMGTGSKNYGDRGINIGTFNTLYGLGSIVVGWTSLAGLADATSSFIIVMGYDTRGYRIGSLTMARATTWGEYALGMMIGAVANADYAGAIGADVINSNQKTIAVGDNLLVLDKDTRGSNKITNGAFTGGTTNWTLGTGWTYKSNRVYKSTDGTGTLSQDSSVMTTPIVAGQTYIIQFSTYNSGTEFTNEGILNVSLGGNSITARERILNFGTVRYVLTAKTNEGLIIIPSNTARFGIDSISVYPITGGNLDVAGEATFGSARTDTIYSFTGENITFYNSTGDGYANLNAKSFNVFSPKDLDYKKDKYLSLPSPDKILGDDGKLSASGMYKNEQKQQLIDDKTKPIYSTDLIESCSNETGKQECKKEEIEIFVGYEKKLINSTDVGELAFNNRIVISELKQEIENLKSRINKIEKETCDIKIFSWCLK